MAPGVLSSSPTSAQRPTSGLPQDPAVQSEHNYDGKKGPSADFEQAGAQVFQRINELEKEIQENNVTIDRLVARHGEIKREYRQSEEVVQSLTKDIIENEKAFNRQNEEIKRFQAQVESWESKCNGERENVASARREINRLHETITGRDSMINDLKSAGSQLKERYAVSKDKIKTLQAEHASLNEKFNEANARLGELEAFVSDIVDSDEDPLIDGFTSLWEYAKNEIYHHMEIDLDSKVLRDRSAWEELKKCDLTIHYRIPLPLSNSFAAKSMRLAIILAVLSREIDRYIFQPTYITGEDCASRKLLANLAATDSKKEVFCRSLLLSLGREYQTKCCQGRIQRIVDHVSSYLCALLSPEQNSQFRQILENIVEKAVEIWQPIQHARRKYESDFEPADSDDESATFVFPSRESAETASDGNPQRQSPLIIFPHMYAIEGNKKILFTPTWELSSMHPEWVAAEQEVRQDTPQSTIEHIISSRLGRALSRRSTNGH